MARLGIITLAALGLASLSLGACNWLRGGAAPPVAVGCGSMPAHVTIRYAGEAPLSTSATLDDNLTDITWTAAAAGTGRTIDGMTASGRSVGSGKPFTATGEGRSAGVGFTLKVTGTINGPPPRPCKGSGTLALTGAGGKSLASGAWTLQ
jgi:hypothetical protein